MRLAMTPDSRTIHLRQPQVVDEYSLQHHPRVAVAGLRAGAVVARLSDVSSVQWVSDGIRAASGVLTVITFSNT